MSELSASSFSARLCTCESAFCPAPEGDALYATKTDRCSVLPSTRMYLQMLLQCAPSAKAPRCWHQAGLHESVVHNNCAINVHERCTHCPSPLNAPEVYLCMTPWLLGCRRQSAFWSWLQYLQTSAQGHLHASQIHAQMSRCWQR